MAPDGNDSWSGKLPEPNTAHTDGPFSTLCRAREAVREVTAFVRRWNTGSSSEIPKGEINVVVRDGKYFLHEPFVLGPADGGTRDCLVTYSAYPGERPVLSGGVKLTGWESYSGDIIRCRLLPGKAADYQ